MKAGRPRGRPTESTPLSGAGRSTDGFGRSTMRSTGGTMVRNMTVASVDQAVDRKVIFDLSRLPTGRFLRGYIYAFSWADFTKIFDEKISYLSSIFQQEFKRVFVVKRSIFILFSRVRKIKEKKKSLGIVFDLHFYFILEVFPSIFFVIFISKLFIFSHLRYHLYPIYRILFLWENWFVVYNDHLELFVIFVITKSCNLSLLWVSL